MKRVIVILIMAISSNIVLAQEAGKSSGASRKERRIAEMEKRYELNKSMLENRDFVLQANSLQDRYGRRVYVNSMINYIGVDSATAVIQTGSDWHLGQNGMGGVTAKGQISVWKLTENKKQNTFNLSFTVTTSIGIFDLRFLVGSSEVSTASLTSLRAGQLTFEGKLVPYRESSVFEGQSR
jgi:hypothetical protein